MTGLNSPKASNGSNDSGRPVECGYGPLLSPYYDGELPPDRHREVAEHVRTCPACAAELAGLRSLSEAFAAAPIPTLSPRALSALRLRLERPGEARHVRVIRWLTAVAAAVFLLAAGRLVYQHYRGPDPRHPDPQGIPVIKPDQTPPRGTGESRPNEPRPEEPRPEEPRPEETRPEETRPEETRPEQPHVDLERSLD